MSFVAISSLLLLLSAVVASPAQPRPGGSLLRRDAVYPVHNPTDTCYPYEVLDNKGKSNQQYQPADTYPTVQGIIGGVPGGNYWENPQGTVYDLGNYMDRKNNLCPNTKYVLVAFSYGTQLTTPLMNNATVDKTHVVAIIHYGDGYYRAGRPEDRGSATTGSGFKANTGLVIPAEYESLTRNYCNINDWECQNLSQNTTTLAAHHTYVNSTYQDDAVSFSIAQLNAAIVPTVSQAAVQAKRRAKAQQIIGDSSMCESGYSYCPREADQWECISTHSALEHCGGCPGGLAGAGYGVDCTAIFGADQVACVQGSCQIATCADGYILSLDGLRCEESG